MAVLHEDESTEPDSGVPGEISSDAWNRAHRIEDFSFALAKLVQISQGSFLARTSAGDGAVEEITASAAKALLAIVIGDVSGLSAALTALTDAIDSLANIATSGSASDLVSGTVPDARMPNTITFTESTPAAPGAGVKIYGSASGGRQMLAHQGPAGSKMLSQPFLGQQHQFSWTTGLNNAILQTGMINPLVTGTANGRAPATTNSYTLTRRIAYTSAGTAASVGGLRCSTAFLTRQQGFHIVFRFGIGDTAGVVTTGRMFVGVRDDPGAPTDANPSGFTNVLGVGTDANDTLLQLYSAGSSAQARASLGASFPANTTTTDMFELALYAPPAGSSVTYQVTRLNTGDVTSGTISAAANLPSLTSILTPMVWRSNGTTATAVSIDLISMYGDTDV